MSNTPTPKADGLREARIRRYGHLQASVVEEKQHVARLIATAAPMLKDLYDKPPRKAKKK